MSKILGLRVPDLRRFIFSEINNCYNIRLAEQKVLILGQWSKLSYVHIRVAETLSYILMYKTSRLDKQSSRYGTLKLCL